LSRSAEALARRERRLLELHEGQQVKRVNAALQYVWDQEGGKRPGPIRLRPGFLLAHTKGAEPVPSPMSQLLNPRGIALRFYLLAIFEAQCRLNAGVEWTSTRSLGGPMGWQDFIAIDAAYDSATGRYMRRTKQGRRLDSSRVRQVQGALRSLEGLKDQALVEVPRKENGQHREYRAFVLMHELGRGWLPTAKPYTTPDLEEWTVDIPRDFFLRGWVSVLYPSEIATWLTLRYLAKRYPGVHGRSGVYLYGQDRERDFDLLRDAYEDGCAMLVDLGLIRRAESSKQASPGAAGQIDLAAFFSNVAEHRSPDRYEPHHYQLVDQGLNEDALSTCLREVVLKRKEAD
jgi:hypothetical protein